MKRNEGTMRPRLEVPSQSVAMRHSSHHSTHSNGHARPETRAASSLDPALIPCGACQSPNPRERKFCSNCGRPLWRPCDNCGEVNAVAENFCGNCGSNLHSAVQERAEQFDHVLAEAERCREQCDFPKAVALLRSAVKEHEGRLDDYVDRARKLIQQISAEQERRLTEAEERFQEALKCVAEYSYETAQALLEEIPQPLRNVGIRHLLGEVRSKRNEVLELGGEIRIALAEKKTLDLMPKLERMIELQPHHHQAKELARQLRLRLHEAARKRVARHKYHEALDLLGRVPDFLRNEEDQKLNMQVSELAWLVDDLQFQPVVDDVLPAVVERLIKLAPNNPLGAKLKQQLQHRLGRRGKDPRFPHISWAAAPERTRLGNPLQWLGGFGRLHDEKLVERPVYRNHPGVYFVACGLALQGLDKSPVRINLMPKKKGGLAGFSLLKRKKAVHSAWGFDVGDASLKAVKLKIDEQGRVSVDVCDRIEYKKALSQPDVEFKQSDIIRDAFVVLFERHSREADRSCVSLPGAKMLGRQFDLPSVKGKKIQDAVEFEATHQIPYPLSDLIWDYQLLDEPGKDGEPDDEAITQRHVLLVAAKDYHVTDFLAIFEHLELPIDVVQSGSIALHNYACYEFFGEDKQYDPDKALAFLDVGNEASNVVVSTPDRVWFRSLRLGGSDITRLLMKRFKLSQAQAEQLKRKPQQARRMSKLYEALTPLFQELAGELDRSFNMHHKVYSQQTITNVYGLGGGFQLHGLMRHLLRGSGVEVFSGEE
jgi:type IV pilus assembly protein PilM